MLYDAALICKNGHIINTNYHQYPENNSAYCSKCGQPTIHKCPSCLKEIKGDNMDEFSFVCLRTTPAYCEHCGKPFPWTESALEAVKLMIEEEDSLSDRDKTSAIESLPDLMAETPKTNLAAIRCKKLLVSAGQFTAEALRQFVIDFGCELAKKSMGL